MLHISSYQHYVAHIRHPSGQWLLCDDQVILPIKRIGKQKDATVTHVLLKKLEIIREENTHEDYEHQYNEYNDEPNENEIPYDDIKQWIEKEIEDAKSGKCNSVQTNSSTTCN